MDMLYLVLAQAVGFVALALNVISYQLKNSRQLILCRAASDAIYIFHYLLLGAYSGCVTLVFCVANGLICGARNGHNWAEWKGWKWVISILLIAASVTTWIWRNEFDPLPNLCSVISILATSWSAWSGRGKVLRVTRLAISGPTWLLYSVLVGSIPGALSEAIGMTSSAIGLWRYRKTPEEEMDFNK